MTAQRGDFDTSPVPDPCFRDQLVQASTAVGDMAEDWWCPKREGVRRTECRYCIAEHVADALLPLIAARVQAAASQRAADELEAVLRWLITSGRADTGALVWLRERATLAQSAPG